MKHPSPPPKAHIPFRYDPPVLLLVMTWHETQAKFGQFLHDRLAFSYFNNTSLVNVTIWIMQLNLLTHLQVYRLDCSLNPEAEKPGEKGDDNVTHMEVNNPEVNTLNFLSQHPTAKIIIIIDTHSVENGAFAWTRNPKDPAGTFMTCYLYEVSEQYRTPHCYCNA